MNKREREKLIRGQLQCEANSQGQPGYSALWLHRTLLHGTEYRAVIEHCVCGGVGAAVAIEITTDFDVDGDSEGYHGYESRTDGVVAAFDFCQMISHICSFATEHHPFEPTEEEQKAARFFMGYSDYVPEPGVNVSHYEEWKPREEMRRRVQIAGDKDTIYLGPPSMYYDNFRHTWELDRTRFLSALYGSHYIAPIVPKACPKCGTLSVYRHDHFKCDVCTVCCRPVSQPVSMQDRIIQLATEQSNSEYGWGGISTSSLEIKLMYPWQDLTHVMFDMEKHGSIRRGHESWYLNPSTT
jgi:hypothetical protein